MSRQELEELIKDLGMREATKEERESVDNYIKSISEPVNSVKEKDSEVNI